MDKSKNIELLRTWAALGAELHASRTRQLPDWSAVNRMIKAVEPLMKKNADRLRTLLDLSRKKLEPLGEPFDLDLGLHRWLHAEREEAYSDWFAWIIQQAKTSARVFGMFSLGVPSELPIGSECKVNREVWVEHGHEGQEGRLDIVITFGDKAVIVVELKKGDGDEADTLKHAGYFKWLEQQDAPTKRAIYVAVNAEREEYEGFTFCSWANVCIQMRLFAVELCKENNPLAASMVLAFVAAAEQNLIGLKVHKGDDGFVDPRLLEHATTFLKAH